MSDEERYSDGSGAWKARKAAQTRGSAEVSDGSSRSHSVSTLNRIGNPSISQSSPLVARKSLSVGTNIRPKSSTPNAIPSTSFPANLAPRSKSQVTSKRITVSSKGIQSSGRAAKSTATTGKTADTSHNVSFSGQVAGPSRAGSSTLLPIPRKSNPVLSDFPSTRIPSAKTAKASPLGRPARISSTSVSLASQKANASVSVAPTVGATSSTPTKSYRPLLPLWQQLDNDRADGMFIHKRDRDGNAIVKRIASRVQRRDINEEAGVLHLNTDDPHHTHAHIGPKLRLRSPDLDDGSDSDDQPRYRPQARAAPNRKVPGTQHAFKAARKFRSVESSPESDSDTSSAATSLGSADQSSEDVDELDSDQYDPQPRPPDEDVEMEDVSTIPRPPEKHVFNTPPPVIVPLPTSPQREDVVPSLEPSSQLLSAAQALTLPTIRMQSAKQLPFLLRNLRRGFLSRCRDLHLPIYHDHRQVKLQVHYGHAGGGSYMAEAPGWRCPLCSLFGTLTTREMLNFHLQSDHPEVYLEWQELQSDNLDMNGWKLQLVLPEPDLPTAPDGPRTPPEFSSPFPSLTLSPPSQPLDDRQSTPLKKEPIIQLYFKREPQGQQQGSASPGLTADMSASRRSHSTAGSATLSRSTSSVARTPYSFDPRVPKPPLEDPLGPATQPPYLPAVSDYGGPTVYYSSRPGGPCLFDLLGTLPMDKFGLLEWEVLDREDEIYESDDVKEEYKVMHALWARWIILNRNEFIADYYKGAIAFVDEYWKIIHKAAGWDALRYFLFILLANQFLNGREVAQILQHYEKHTGMAYW